MNTRHTETRSSETPAAPLASHGDIREFRHGFERFVGGFWPEGRWKTFRLRFGIYAQRQPGLHMVRARFSGGRMTLEQARGLARAARRWTGGDVHLTTRQGVQFYGLTLERLPGFLEDLALTGVTTREASGNTLRNVVACPLAGRCPHEIADAGEVAERLGTAWARHPLVQHMPRKLKTAVSGCARDCADARHDDLGFVAVTDAAGRTGFRVLAGGGLGGRPADAVVVFDFVTEDELTAVQEALVRLHHRHSNRADKNGSRVKFLVRRFGAEEFAARLRDQFELVRGLPRRAWRPLARGGGRDGETSLTVLPPLGMIDPGGLERLADLAEAAGARGFRILRSQRLDVVGLTPDAAADLGDKVRALGLEVGAGADLITCRGTTTCTIGITDSPALAGAILKDARLVASLDGLSVRISGCHNSCGRHHLADIGLHGLAKKIDGRPAPHYQLHLGGGEDGFGIAGPVIPAARVPGVVRELAEAFNRERTEGEGFPAWVRRVGPDRIETLARLAADGQGGPYRDLGHNEDFSPPATASGECASEAVVGEYLADLARANLLDMDRFAVIGDVGAALGAGRRSLRLAARRLLAVAGYEPGPGEDETVIARVGEIFAHDRTLLDGLEAALSAEGDRLRLERWLDVSEETIERLLSVKPDRARAAP